MKEQLEGLDLEIMRIQINQVRDEMSETKKELLGKLALEIKNPPKLWWEGDSRVEEFMPKVREAIERNIQGGNTDIYNRCYESVYAAIIKYADKKAGEL